MTNLFTLVSGLRHLEPWISCEVVLLCISTEQFAILTYYGLVVGTILEFIALKKSKGHSPSSSDGKHLESEG